jgi:rhomboid family protein
MSQIRHRNEAFPLVIKNLVIINILVWVAQITLSTRFQLTDMLTVHPILPGKLEQLLTQSGEINEIGRFNPYQLITYMFAHSALDPRGGIVFSHIFFNMFAIWMFGRVLENVWGSKRFLFFYLASGVGAALIHLIVQYFRAEQLLQAALANDQAGIARYAGALAPMLGASGALMGVMAAFAYLFPNTELMIIPIPFPIKAKWLVIGYIVLDLFGGFGNFEGDNVAHFTHLGGALVGFIIVYIWNKTNRKTLY